MRKIFLVSLIFLITNIGFVDAQKYSSSINFYGEKTDVYIGDDIIVGLSIVNLDSNPKMHAQVIILPSSGMSVTSAEFTKISAGQFANNYELEPGDGRDIVINLRSNQIGEFKIKGRVVYYFGEDKNNTQDYVLDLPVTVIRLPVTAQNSPIVTIPNHDLSKENKFRVGPTVNLRPVKDDINKSEDGLIELYIDNPSLNDVVMHTDIRISVPSGISIYGQGFGDAGSAGVVHGVFEIFPGRSRTIQMTVKAEKTGEFIIKFSGLYWPGDDKDAFELISLTHNFKVHDIPAASTVTPSPVIGGFEIIAGIGILIISYLLFKTRKN